MNQPTSGTPGEPAIRTRTVAHLHTGDESAVTVEHVYEPDGADVCECGNPTHDPGLVGIIVHDEDGCASTLLTAEDALVLANRLQRAASLVLESLEDVPDVEREAARLTGGAA